MTFRVGQRVVCISDGTTAMRKFPGSQYPLKNNVYTIATINDWPSGTLLTFCEMDNRNFIGKTVNGVFCTIEPGFGARHFRPLTERKTDISVFTKMLTPQGVEA